MMMTAMVAMIAAPLIRPIQGLVDSLMVFFVFVCFIVCDGDDDHDGGYDCCPTYQAQTTIATASRLPDDVFFVVDKTKSKFIKRVKHFH